MNIQYASDLHLEFSENESFICNNPLEPCADILVLAGDICLLKDLPEHNWFFDYLSANFKLTCWIPGNHEWYHYDLSNRPTAFRQIIRDNVFLVNNFSETIENVQLIFSTLWTHISERNQMTIEKRINDFHLIRWAVKD